MESSSTREKTSVPIDGAIHMHIETKQIVAIVFFFCYLARLARALQYMNPVGLVDR